MRTLDEAGKVKFVTVTGGHLEISDDDMKKYIVPYLVDEALENSIMKESLESFQNRNMMPRVLSENMVENKIFN